MKLVADLHLHSHFSRATSRDLTLPTLARWAQIKGVQIVGTGDIAHPGWLAEMKEHLEPAEPGLFRLKEEVARSVAAKVPASCQGEVRFLLAGEISNIYKRAGRTRKVHHVVFAPSFTAVEKLQARLERIGNIRSDGRPILGLASHDLLEIVLATDPACCLIPAHIWTPWFALLGSMSGYDSVEACFGDLAPHIFALETGLSSDPAMNWRVSGLDRYTLVSNSDAHSPPKLGREATLFDCDLSYDALFAALRSGDPAQFKGTIEFFPEEGKYHVDGHRKCGIRWDPPTTLAHRGLCEVCGKPVTVGVMHRVEMLADRPAGATKANAHPYHSLIPLPEILAEFQGTGVGAKGVQQQYDHLLTTLGPELGILLDRPLDAIAAAAGERFAAGIGRMRRGEVTALAGYDGEYGVIRIFDERAASASAAQMRFFDEPEGKTHMPPMELARPAPPLQLHDAPLDLSILDAAATPPALNEQQSAAVLTTAAPLIIVAGPGTGKTRTLTARIGHLVQAHGAAPESILAITFTNKAAAEMAHRLHGLVGPGIASRITIKTFHAFGLQLLHEFGDRLGLPPAFVILGEEERLALLKSCWPDLGEAALRERLAQISAVKNQMADGAAPLDPALLEAYAAALRRSQAIDIDDLLLLPVQMFAQLPDVLAAVQARYRWLSVDEYQDINAVQYRLLRQLTANGANLCVIGDPDQAIYGFRGADRRYFFSFTQDFPLARQLHLRRNYRSTQTILDAAAQVIARNPDRVAERIFSTFASQVKLEVYQAATDKAEAEYVVHQIEQMIGGVSLFSRDSGRVADAQPGQRSFADFAVLYRLNAQSRALIEAFDRSGIPYQCVGQTPLYAHKIVRTALAALWLLHNPLSQAHLELISARAWAAMQPLLPRSGRAAAQVASVAQWLQTHQKLTPVEIERLQQLSLRAAPFDDDLASFLESTLLQSESDDYDPRADRVTLMTLHAAKGLEFPIVFMVGCEEGLLPYLPEKRTVDVEEERRLFYVGMTRAQERLVLSHAQTRFLFGQRLRNRPSRFVNDIANALKELRQSEPKERQAPGPEHEQLSLF